MNPNNQPTSSATGATAQIMQAKTNPNSTQNTLQISEIRDGIVIMNDGSFRAVIMCKSINFDLMSPEEREAVEFSYQGFLNSLYFPVQIFIRSQKVDLKPYLERMDKIRIRQDNMLLGLLMEDYIAFLADIAQQTNIMDKRFYMVIKYPDVDQDIRKALKQSTGFFTGLTSLFAPGKPGHVVIDENNLEKAKTELRNRVQAAMQGLAQAGIQSLPLDTEELIELYYDTYNPDTATRQQIKDFSNLTAPVITKGEGSAPQPDMNEEMN
jgi:type IV secretory pathway VirB4 component